VRIPNASVAGAIGVAESHRESGLKKGIVLEGVVIAMSMYSETTATTGYTIE
jgi:hypothetical protein